MTHTGSTVIELCGRLRVQIDGERVEHRLRGRQGRLLLAYLVLHRDRPVRRDELLDVLWPDGDPPAGDGVLAPPLSRLRKALGAERLAGRGELSLVLPADAQIDWEIAHRALAGARADLDAQHWAAARDGAQLAAEIAGRGLLPGLEAGWIDECRATLRDLRVEALELLATAALRLGGPDLAAAERAARAAVEAAPFRESARAALMEALRARGNGAEALRVYEDARRLLREELGTTPGAALVALHERLLREEAAAPGPPPVPAPPAAAPPPGLVGRDLEQARLARLVADSLGGAGRAGLIEGPAGIGKSRLLAEVRRLAEGGGARVLSARSSQLERELPFGVARQLFEMTLADPDVRARVLAGAAAPAASAIFGESAGDAEEVVGDASFAVLHGLYWLTLNLAAERPLVVICDDLQWCDAPSLRFLAYLARRIEGQPVLLAGGQRTGEPPTDPALAAEILQDPALVVLRPCPLDEAAVGELVRERLGTEPEPAFRAACHRTTGGNPLLLRQLLIGLETGGVRPDAAHAGTVRAIGSRAIASTVGLRLARLPPDATAVARAIAVLGEDAELPAVAAMAGLDEHRVAAATAELARVEILRAGTPFGFVHPLVLDAVYDAIAPGERELAHARAAEIVREAGAGPQRVATHVLAMPPRGEAWVVELLRRAAAGALRSGGSQSAVAYLRRALQEPPPPGEDVAIEVDLGLAEALTNATEAGDRLMRVHDRLVDPAQRAQVADVLGRALMFSGRAAAGQRVARSTAASLPAGFEDARRRLEAFALIANCFEVPDPSGFHEAARYREQPVDSEGTGHLAIVAALQWAYTDGGAEECSALARAGLRTGRLVETDNGLLSVAAALVLDLADADDVHPLWDELLAIGHQRGSLFSISSVHLWRGYTLWRRGDLADAEESLRAAMDEISLYSYGSEAESYAGGFMAGICVDRGDLEGARRGLDWSGVVGRTSIGGRYWRLSRLALLLHEGRDAEALVAAEEAQDLYAWIENPADGSVLVSRALALARLGRTGEALEVAEGELERARRWGAPGTVGPIMRVIGTLRGADGLEVLEEAVATLDESPRRLERARAHLALGEALLGLGREAAARDVLRRGHVLATVCAAHVLAERAAALLVAAGGAPDSPAGPDALTRTERRAAELAAEGRDDRDVAQAMFLTPHAVERRLAAVQRKLGVASRGELAAVLAG